MTRQLHVAVIGHSAATSGAELALSRVLPLLLAEDSLLMTIVLAEDGPLVPILRSQGARVVILPLDEGVRSLGRYVTSSPQAAVGSALLLLSYTHKLARFLRAERVHVVHTNSLKAAVYGGAAGRLARIPVLWHLRDRLAPDYMPDRTARFIRLLGRFLPTQIAVNSSTTGATMLSKLSKIVQVVPDCVQLPDVQSEARATPERVLWLGMMGRLAPWKGQHILIAAFAHAFRERSGIRLALVGSAMFGDADYELQLKEQVAELGLGDRIDFRGFRPDIWSEYAGFDVAVHASVIPEPFGQVVIEAMACGVAVVAADAGGPAEIVTDGTDGLLVPPGDIAALSRALQRLIDDPELRHRLGNAGKRRAADFGPHVTAAALLDLYRGLAPGTSW